MRLFGWFRHPAQQEKTAAPAPRRWGWIGGRRVLGESLYVMPKDKAEGDRLDLQHHLLKVALGRNYYPRLRSPRAILDVACGTGIWGREMASEFKRAQVIGFDIDRTPMEASLARSGAGGQFPPNFTFQQANALERFPFADQSFDFTHARFLGAFVPIARWPELVTEMARVTSRGSYVECVELETVESPSPALTLLKKAGKQLMDGRGLHQYPGASLGGYLRQAGLSQIQERRVVLGVGRQGNRQQRLLATDMISIFTNLQPIMVKVGLFSEAEYHGLLAQLREELPRLGLTMPVIFAFGLRLE